jgi:hypothetical protein
MSALLQGNAAVGGISEERLERKAVEGLFFGLG